MYKIESCAKKVGHPVVDQNYQAEEEKKNIKKNSCFKVSNDVKRFLPVGRHIFSSNYCCKKGRLSMFSSVSLILPQDILI